MEDKELKRLKNLMLESANDSIFLHDDNGNFIYVNEAAYKRRGYTKEELLEMNLKDLDVPEYAALIKPRIKDMMKTGSAIFESAHQRKDGSVMDVEIHAKIIKSDNKKLILSIVRDITRRKKAENALKESQEQLERKVENRTRELKENESILRAILESSNDSIFLISNDGIVLDINTSTARRFNIDSAQMKGKHIKNYISDEMYKSRWKFIKKAIKTKKPVNFQDKRKDIYFDHYIYPIKEDGEVKKLAVYSHDITERKKAEREIKRNLEEKEILLKEIHHRVKNNLLIISSLLNLQSEYIMDKTSREIFKESQNRAKSMALIHERLYQSQDLKNIDFSDYIKTLANELLETYSDDHGRIKLEINAENIMLDINTTIPLGLIMNELVTNSLKHAFPDGETGKIQIDFNQKNKHYEFVVKDNGIGFPDNIDFEHTDSMGLKIVTTLTNQIDGKIELNRTHGTTFTINFTEHEI